MSTELDKHRKKFDKELKSGLLSMLVLLAIKSEGKDTYGYRIIKTLETGSKGKFKFPEGTVYPILSSLSTKGLVKNHWGDSKEGPRRKYYQITPLGKKVLSVYLEDWKEVSSLTNGMIQNMGDLK